MNAWLGESELHPPRLSATPPRRGLCLTVARCDGPLLGGVPVGRGGFDTPTETMHHAVAPAKIKTEGFCEMGGGGTYLYFNVGRSTFFPNSAPSNS